MTETEERLAVVAEARTWLRTPYAHRQRVKGAGVDCAMLLAEVYHAAVPARVPAIEPPPYPRDWHLHQDVPLYEAFVAEFARQIPEAEWLPGDCVLYRFGRVRAHGGIKADRRFLIHSYVSTGVTLQEIDAGWLAERDPPSGRCGEMTGLFGKKPQASSAPSYTGVDIQTSALMLPVPVLIGVDRLAGNLIGYKDFTATKGKAPSGGKGGAIGGGGKGSTGETTTYSATLMIALCEGQITSVGKVWNDKSITDLSSLGMTLFGGGAGQAAWGYLTTNYPSSAFAYAGTCYVAGAKLQLGQTPTIGNFTFELQSASSAAYGSEVDSSIATICNILLSETKRGIGFTALGDFSYFLSYCNSLGLIGSYYARDQQAIRDTLTALARSANTEWLWSGGILTPVPQGDEAVSGNGFAWSPPSTLYDLGYDDYIFEKGKAAVGIERPRSSDIRNAIKLEWKDRSNDYNIGSVEAKDEASISQIGVKPANVIQSHHFKKQAPAQLSAQFELAWQAGRNTYTAKLDARYSHLDPLDTVTFTDALADLSLVPGRIRRVSIAPDGSVTISAREWLAGTGNAASYAFDSDSRAGEDFNAAAPSVATPYLFEPPPGLTSDRHEVWIAVTGLGNWGGCEVHLSEDGTTYRQIDTILGGARYGTLSTTLPTGTSPDTSHTPRVNLTASAGILVAGTTTDATSLNTLSLVGGYELLAYRDATLVSPNVYDLGYLVRGAYGSTIGSHAIAESFIRLDESIAKYEFDSTRIGDTVYFKFVSFNRTGGGRQDIGSVTAYPRLLTGNSFQLQPAGTATDALALGGVGATTVFDNISQAAKTTFNASWGRQFDAGLDGFLGSSATLSVSGGILTVTATGADPQLYFDHTISGHPNETGAINRFVQIRARPLAASPTWDGTIYYETAGHTFSGSFCKTIPNPGIAQGVWRVFEWDMSALTVGGTDWTSNTITGIRIDLANSVQNWEVDWVAIGSSNVERSAVLDGRIETALTSAGVVQSSITTGARNTSSLLGYGGGAVYGGDLNATYGASFAGNLTGVPTPIAAVTNTDLINNALVPLAAYNKNPTFQAWSGSLPDNWAAATGGLTSAKNTTSPPYGAWSWTVGATGTADAYFQTAAPAEIPVPAAPPSVGGNNYVTITWDITWRSGADSKRAGFLYRQTDVAGTNGRGWFGSIFDEVPAPVVGQRYSRRKTVAQSEITGTGSLAAITQSSLWVMPNWASLPGGAGSIKSFDVNFLEVRPASAQEISAVLGFDVSGVLQTNITTGIRNGSSLLGYSGGSLYTGDLNATLGANWASTLTSRPTELTDGRVSAGFDSSGDLNRNMLTARRNSSSLLGYTSGGLYAGDLNATLGAAWASTLTGRPANISGLTGTEGILNSLVPLPSYNKNPTFQSWAATLPDNWSIAAGAPTTIKNTSYFVYGAWSWDMECTTSADAYFLATSASELPVPGPAPSVGGNFYVTVTYDVAWVSGDSKRAGAVYRQTNTSGANGRGWYLSLYDEIGPSPVSGQRYQGRKTIPAVELLGTGALGSVTGSQLYTMLNWSSLSGGAGSAKRFIWNFLEFRPASAQEISAVLGFDVSGVLQTNINTTIRNGSSLLGYSGGSTYIGDLNATLGAAWGTNLTARPTELTDGRVAAGFDSSGDLNRNILLARRNSSSLLGYSGGAAYIGDLNATLGAAWATNLTGRPTPIAAVTNSTLLDNALLAMGDANKARYGDVSSETYGWAYETSATAVVLDAPLVGNTRCARAVTTFTASGQLVNLRNDLTTQPLIFTPLNYVCIQWAYSATGPVTLQTVVNWYSDAACTAYLTSSVLTRAAANNITVDGLNVAAWIGQVPNTAIRGLAYLASTSTGAGVAGLYMGRLSITNAGPTQTVVPEFVPPGDVTLGNVPLGAGTGSNVALANYPLTTGPTSFTWTGPVTATYLGRTYSLGTATKTGLANATPYHVFYNVPAQTLEALSTLAAAMPYYSDPLQRYIPLGVCTTQTSGGTGGSGGGRFNNGVF